MKMSNFDPFKPFNRETCNLCGECFSKCPVMNLPPDEAKEEIKRLIKSSETKHVLQKCTSCFDCNFICPQRSNPTQLILDRWHEKYLREGMPLRAGYFIPHSYPNFRTYVLDKLPRDEREILASWDDLSPCEEMCYPGCNIITLPYLTKTKLLEGLDIRGSLDKCCGEMYYRMGLFDQVEQVAKRMENYFEKLGVKKMVIMCTAGYNMFTNVLPKFGVNLDFEIQPLLSWLWERIEDGRIKIKKRVNMRVTIQESCYGKVFGKNYLDLPRKILESIGAKVVEMEYCRECALCCGIGGGFSHESGFHPADITAATEKSLREAEKTGAEATVVYCAGCLQMLSVGKIAIPIEMPIYHILEMLQLAIGEKPARRQDQRARQILEGVMENQFPIIDSKERFWAKEIKSAI